MLVVSTSWAHAAAARPVVESIVQPVRAAGPLTRAVEASRIPIASPSFFPLSLATDDEGLIALAQPHPWALERDDPYALTARVTYTVAPGDTLGGIARKYDVKISDIRKWNRLKGDHIAIGQRLTIHTRGGSSAVSRERVRHEVTSGQTGAGIARRYGVSVDELRRWNPDANIDRLRIGQTLVVYSESRSGSSRSSTGGPTAGGTPNRGRLSAGVQLTSGEGLRVRNPARSYGMPVTIDALRSTYGRLAAHFAEGTEVLVGDVSLQGGGRMTPHRSHQNGLDADVAYITTDCIGTLCTMAVARADTLDAVRQWYVFEEWLRTNIVEYIFVSYDLQKPLYEYAQERGATPDELNRWFQYPRGRGASVGVIRHEAGHANHYHVRFRDQG